MLSKNNVKEYIEKNAPTKQRFTIKKLTVGVASVLIGMTLPGLQSHPLTRRQQTAGLPIMMPAARPAASHW